MRKLATIQVIKSLEPIPNADRILLARFQDIGWQCVVAKDDGFAAGDLAVFLEVDSLVDLEQPRFAFMAAHKGRVRTIRLRGVWSQGLALPLAKFPELAGLALSSGLDLTATLGVQQYVPPEPVSVGGDVLGSFPTAIIPKTDELRVQAYPLALEELAGLPAVATVKCDGASGTIYRWNDHFGVCSRNLEMKDTPENAFWKVARKYDLAERMPNGYAVQFEACGEGIQKNRLGIRGVDGFVFNVWSITESRYLDHDAAREFARSLGLPLVPEAHRWAAFDASLEELLAMAQGVYAGTRNQREGIVVRPLQERYSPTLGGRLSFKVLNNVFLLAED
jgi:RNA ligase (TIGR02306 family)